MGISGSSTIEVVGAGYFGSTVNVTGAISGSSTISAAGAITTAGGLSLQGSGITNVGPIAGLTNISGSGTFQTVGNSFFGAAVNVTGAVSLAAGDGALQFTKAGENSIKIPDNQGSALVVEEANNAYMTFDTTNSSERIKISQITTIADDTKLYFGTNEDWSIEYDEDGDNDLKMAGTALTVTADTATFTSANQDDPLVVIQNTTNDPSGPRLRFVKDKGAAGAANDIAGMIEFYADDANQDQVLFGRIRTRVAVATNGQEGGKMHFSVASHDGELNHGLVIADGDAEDEVDVQVGNGAASVVTIPGVLSVANDIILDDGGSLKEGGGTAALTIDGSGNVTKIGVSTQTDGHFLKYDGSKWLGAAISAGAAGSDTQVQFNDGGSTLAGDSGLTWNKTSNTLFPTNISGSGTLQVVGNTFLGADLNVTGSTTLAGTTSAQAVTFTNASGSGTLEVVGNTFIGGTLNVTGNADFNGTITCDDSITIDSITITDTEIGYLDGLTLGTVAASKVVTVDSSKDFSGYRNISGSGTLQSVGNAFLGGTLNVTGNVTLAADLSVGDDLSLASDSAVFNMGVGNDFTITHDGTTGATIAGNPIVVDSGGSLTLDSHVGIFIFKDAGTEVLRFTEGSSGDVTIKLATNGKDLVFTDNGDATNMKILDAAAGINVPGEVQTTKIAYTDGDDSMTIADGGGVTFSSTAKLLDDKKLTFGTNDDWTIEYDEDGDDDLVMYGENLSIECETSQKPVVMIKNTTNDANGAILRFVKDKGAAGAANDVAGMIEFYADDANQDQVLFSRIASQVSVHTNGQEGGLLALQVASHDGEINNGLVLTDGSAEDEVDVTIGNGAASVVTAPGILSGTAGLQALNLTVGGAGNRGFDEDGQISCNAINVNSSGITNAGAIAGATTISGSGNASAFTFTAEGGFKVGSTQVITEDKQLRARQVLVTRHHYENGSSAAFKWISFMNAGEVNFNSAVYTNSMVAPFDGRLVRVLAKFEDAQDGNVTISVATGSGLSVSGEEPVEHVVVSMGDGANLVGVFNTTGSQHFTAGSLIGIGVDPNASPGRVSLSCIWEYDMTGL